LALDKDKRPDVIEAFSDPYIRSVAKKPKQGGVPSEGDAGSMEGKQAVLAHPEKKAVASIG